MHPGMLKYNCSMATAATRLTYDDLRQIPPDRNRYELIEGELFVSAAPNIEYRVVGSFGPRDTLQSPTFSGLGILVSSL
jgi:hypothetical protein